MSNTPPPPPPQTPAPHGLLSDEAIPALAALLPYVTKGPWALNGEYVTHHANGYTVCRLDGIESREVIEEDRAYPSRNGEFIVQAREWLPFLLGENAALRKQKELLTESDAQNAREIADLRHRLQEAQQELAEQEREKLALVQELAKSEEARAYFTDPANRFTAARRELYFNNLLTERENGKVQARIGKLFARAAQQASPVPEAAEPAPGREEGGVQG